MSRFVAILLLAAVAVVGINAGPAQAATPPIWYGGAAYAPWTADIQTGKVQANGLCLSYDEVRLRFADAAAQASSLYPSTDVLKPDPRAVAAYRAAVAQVAQDVAGMSTECRLTLAWQVRTVVKHLALRDKQIFLSKDGRHTLLSSKAPCDVIVASVAPMDNLTACEPDAAQAQASSRRQQRPGTGRSRLARAATQRG